MRKTNEGVAFCFKILSARLYASPAPPGLAPLLFLRWITAGSDSSSANDKKARNRVSWAATYKFERAEDTSTKF